MADSSTSIVPLFGRVLMAVIFLISGLFKIAGYGQIVAYAAAKGLPLAGVAIACAAAVEILGGLAVLVGFRVRIAAWVLFLYLIPTTFVFHRFWAVEGAVRQDNMVHFLKNLAIMGGLLVLAAYGGGAYSVDARADSKAPAAD
ncbi:MAG TPA: DoxX family protein [Candidatus Cybelea sp.]|nr:DoxX family protein [Candidatus Cybelea sp.]